MSRFAAGLLLEFALGNPQLAEAARLLERMRSDMRAQAAYFDTVGVEVKGLRDLQRDLRRIDAEIAKELRDGLRQIGDRVRDDARGRLVGISPSSARSIRTVVRQTGVSVQQSRSRTTGKRPDFGRLQMARALQPALDAHTDDAAARIYTLVDRIARRHGF